MWKWVRGDECKWNKRTVSSTLHRTKAKQEKQLTRELNFCTGPSKQSKRSAVKNVTQLEKHRVQLPYTKAKAQGIRAWHKTDAYQLTRASWDKSTEQFRNLPNSWQQRAGRVERALQTHCFLPVLGGTCNYLTAPVAWCAGNEPPA